ncbi:MAG TPA: hypothetical protein VNO70_09060 [Blastocatellia bacterium]|nr:hypothetical protein [Blastocatellia bacterium]
MIMRKAVISKRGKAELERAIAAGLRLIKANVVIESHKTETCYGLLLRQRFAFVCDLLLC